MQYEQPLFRPPSEAYSYILQASIGCSWNHCTYCDMYRSKKFRVRPLAENLRDLREAAAQYGAGLRKIFVADGDALVMGLDDWLPILDLAREQVPTLKQVSCYATARNILAKTPDELQTLREHGLSLLYIGPESGDDVTLKRLAKGATHDEHVEAARKAHDAGMKISVITLLGAGGTDRSQEHARETARLITGMDPEYLAALTLTVVPGTPQEKLVESGRFELPDIDGLLGELRTIVAEAAPSDALFRTNHASNYLPIGGRLPRDRDNIVKVLDSALNGEIPLKPEWARGL